MEFFTTPKPFRSKTNVKKNPLVLVADDDPTTRAVIRKILQDQRYDVEEQIDGQTALDWLQETARLPDVVLIDNQMPGLSGMELVRGIKANARLQRLPLVMVTSDADPDHITKGIESGVFYYLTKPIMKDVFSSVVEAATNESKRQKKLNTEFMKHRSGFNMIDDCHFSFHNMEDAENLACFLANFFPDPARTVTGLAELFVNAIEHGNLQIGYEEKTQLLRLGRLQDEIDSRLASPSHRRSKVDVRYTKRGGVQSVTVRDEGQGFDWQKYLYFDPARANDNHGRGIAQANMVSFDKLIYNSRGNEVTAVIGQAMPLEW